MFSLGGFFSFSVWSGALKVLIEKGKKEERCVDVNRRAIKVKWAWKEEKSSPTIGWRDKTTQCIKLLSVQHSCHSLLNSNPPSPHATLAFYQVASVQATTTTTHHIGPDLVLLLKSSSSFRNKIWTFLSISASSTKSKRKFHFTPDITSKSVQQQQLTQISKVKIAYFLFVSFLTLGRHALHFSMLMHDSSAWVDV